MRDCGQFWQEFLDITRLSLENFKVVCFMVAINMVTVYVVVKSCNLIEVPMFERNKLKGMHFGSRRQQFSIKLCFLYPKLHKDL
jgi:hypothetical protein